MQGKKNEIASLILAMTGDNEFDFAAAIADRGRIGLNKKMPYNA